MESPVLVAGLVVAGGVWGLAADRIGARWPAHEDEVDEVGATRAYKNMMGRYESVPMMGKQSLDLDDYVTNKSLDGLFYMVAEEEKKIRQDPVKAGSDIIRKVFGALK